MKRGRRTVNEVIGDTLIDLGKLLFGGIVLAGIVNSNINGTLLVSFGGLLCVAAIAWGVGLITKKD